MDNKLNKDEIVPFQIDLYNKYPKDDMPISYDKNGVVLSRFDDDFWDFLPDLSRRYTVDC